MMYAAHFHVHMEDWEDRGEVVPRFCSSVLILCGACVRKTSAVAMSIGERDSLHVGSARRRRERRLCCFLRHEGMAVRMALPRATHHAVQRHECAQTVSPRTAETSTSFPFTAIEVGTHTCQHQCSTSSSDRVFDTHSTRNREH